MQTTVAATYMIVLQLLLVEHMLPGLAVDCVPHSPQSCLRACQATAVITGNGAVLLHMA